VNIKISAQDVIAGGLLIAFAAVGYWLNLEHPLGTARRMGPGYMPMLTFWILGGLGLAVLLIGLTSGPAEVGAKGWKEIVLTLVAGAALVPAVLLSKRIPGLGGVAVEFGYVVAVVAVGYYFKSDMLPILAALVFFWFSLDTLGFFICVIGTVLISAFAERPPHPVRMLAIAAALMLISWAIFIRGLDIRVPLWPQL
jgi:hypothetical protein